MGIAYNTNIVKDNLVIHLDAANVKSYPGSGAVWNDLSGNGYSASLFNSPTFDSAGKFISFDGVTQYATFTTSSFNTGNNKMFSFEVLFKMRELPTAEYGANGHIIGGQNGDNVVLYVNPAVDSASELNLVYDDTRYTAGTGHITNSKISANEWVHWVCCGDGANNTIDHYINGVPDKISGAVVLGQEVKPWNTFKIAYDSRWATYSKLDIAMFKQYDKKLSEVEVIQNFESLRWRYGI